MKVPALRDYACARHGAFFLGTRILVERIRQQHKGCSLEARLVFFRANKTGVSTQHILVEQIVMKNIVPAFPFFIWEGQLRFLVSLALEA